MSDENIQNSSHRTSDLIFGIIFICLGSYRFYQLYLGEAMAKIRIFIGAAIFIWGVFKLYAYFKTKPRVRK